MKSEDIQDCFYIEEIDPISPYNWSLLSRCDKFAADRSSTETSTDGANHFIRKVKQFSFYNLLGTEFKQLAVDDPESSSAQKLLIGNLVPINKGFPDIKIKLVVSKHIFNLAQADSYESTGFWVQGLDLVWYELVGPSLDSYKEVFAASVRLTNNLPVESSYGRKTLSLKGFNISDGERKLKSVLSLSPHEALYLDGSISLTSENGLSSSSIFVKTKIVDYEFYLNRKEWELRVCSNQNIWYRLHDSSQDYKKIFSELLGYSSFNQFKVAIKDYFSPSSIFFKGKNVVKVDYFRVFDSEGEEISSILSKGFREPVQIRGKLVPNKAGDRALPICIHGKKPVLDLGQKPLRSDAFSVYIECYGLLALLMKPQTTQCISAKIIDKKVIDSLLGYFDWKVTEEGMEKEEIWWHLENYEFFKRTERGDKLCVYSSIINECHHYFSGYISPVPSNPEQETNPSLYMRPILVTGFVTEYSVDFGMKLNDPDSGLWVRNNKFQSPEGYCRWIKLVDNSSHPDFERVNKEDQYLVQGLIKLHSALFNLDATESYVTYLENGLYKVTIDVRELFELCSDYVDLEFIRRHGDWILERFECFLDRKKAGKFIKSVNDMQSAPRSYIETIQQKQTNMLVKQQQTQQPLHTPTSSSSSSSDQSSKTKPRVSVDEEEEFSDTFSLKALRKPSDSAARSSQQPSQVSTSAVKQELVKPKPSSPYPINNISSNHCAIPGKSSSNLSQLSLPAKKVSADREADSISQGKRRLNEFESNKEQLPETQVVKRPKLSETLNSYQDEEDDDGDLVMILCDQCKSTVKLHRCTNYEHKNGRKIVANKGSSGKVSSSRASAEAMSEKIVYEALCKYCVDIKKDVNCPIRFHQDGMAVKLDKLPSHSALLLRKYPAASTYLYMKPAAPAIVAAAIAAAKAATSFSSTALVNKSIVSEAKAGIAMGASDDAVSEESHFTASKQLCGFCESKQKRKHCNNIHHKDGRRLDPSNMCFYCGSLIKSRECPNSHHVAGRKVINRALCSFCESLDKYKGCNHAEHVDGQFLKNYENLCRYCKSLSKKPNCKDENHADGEPYKLRFLNALNSVRREEAEAKTVQTHSETAKTGVSKELSHGIPPAGDVVDWTLALLKSNAAAPMPAAGNNASSNSQVSATNARVASSAPSIGAVDTSSGPLPSIPSSTDATFVARKRSTKGNVHWADLQPNGKLCSVKYFDRVEVHRYEWEEDRDEDTGGSFFDSINPEDDFS